MLCEAEFATQEELEGHQLSCGGADTCEDCSYKNEVDKVTEAFCNYIKKYNPNWIVNQKDATESIYSHLYESKNPVRFFDIFKFCAINQVSSLSLDLAADILKSFPLKIHNSALEKHVLPLPHN